MATIYLVNNLIRIGNKCKVTGNLTIINNLYEMNRQYQLLVVFLIIWSISFNGYSQDQQYYLKLNGDTVFGKLRISQYTDNSRKIDFVDNERKRKVIYPQTASYVYVSKDFQLRSVIFWDQRLFMEPVYEGRVSVYNYIRYENRNSTLMNSRVLIKSNGEGIEISGLTFKSQMKKFFDDCNRIIEGLDGKTYKFKDMVKIAEDYEDCEVKQDEITISKNVSLESISLIENLKSFRISVTKVIDFENKSDLLELVDDLIQRLQKQETIPSYLWLALVSMTEGDENLNSKANKIKEEADQGN